MQEIDELYAKIMATVVAGLLANPEVVHGVVDRNGDSLHILTGIAYGFGDEPKESSAAICDFAQSIVDSIIDSSMRDVKETS